MVKMGLASLAMLAGLTFCPGASALSPPQIYWVDRGADTIGAARAAGTVINDDFIVGANLPEGVAVDGQHIYWGRRTYATRVVGEIGGGSGRLR